MIRYVFCFTLHADLNIILLLILSIPQYVVGHNDRVEKIRHYVDHNRLSLDLVGASFDGVSVNDCVHNALKTEWWINRSPSWWKGVGQEWWKVDKSATKFHG